MRSGAWRPILLFGSTTLLAASLVHPGSVGASGDLAKGEVAFVRQCALCHTIKRGEPNRYGPNLFGIVNGRAASVSGFKYSSAFKAAASWDWSPDVLAAWIAAPGEMVPGTTMSIFQGVADRDKDDIVVYLAAQK